MKKTWCRTKRTGLGYKKPKEKRWRCPDCKQRFKVCSTKTCDNDIFFFGPPHKKAAKATAK